MASGGRNSARSLNSGAIGWVFSFLTLRGMGDGSATGYLLAGGVAYSLIPLAIAIASAGEAPFLFTAGFRLGAFIGQLAIVIVAYKSLAFNRQIWSLIRHRMFSWLILGVIVGKTEYAFLAWSTHFIDISVSAVIYECWPILLIFVTGWLFRNEERYKKVTLWSYVLLAIAFVGVAFVVYSQSDDAGGFATLSLSDLAYGLILISIAIIFTSFAGFAFRWGADLANELQKTDPTINVGSVSLFGALVASVIGNGVAVFITIAATPFADVKSFDSGLAVLPVAFITGVSAFAVADGLWRKANLITHNLGINAIVYLIPILSLTWLFVFSQAEVARWDFLIIGATAIITVNLLINFEASIRMGFKALVIALGGCGAFVYLREDIFEFLNVSQWHWTGGGYFQSITLAATVFILLLAFRVSRVVTRASDEDNRTFLVYRKLDMLARRKVIDHQVCQYVLDLDRANNNSTIEQEAYNKARELIEAVDPSTLDTTDAQLLSDAEANLDALVDSKRVDIHLGETFALFIFGGITIGLALLSLPPQAAGWTRLLVDLVAMLVSSVIVYLLFHIQDLQQERDEHNLDSEEVRPGQQLRSFARFLDMENQAFNQWLSILVGVAIVLTYAALLGHKWVEWF